MSINAPEYPGYNQQKSIPDHDVFGDTDGGTIIFEIRNGIVTIGGDDFDSGNSDESVEG